MHTQAFISNTINAPNAPFFCCSNTPLPMGNHSNQFAGLADTAGSYAYGEELCVKDSIPEGNGYAQRWVPGPGC